jgi:hypothetical protein
MGAQINRSLSEKGSTPMSVSKAVAVSIHNGIRWPHLISVCAALLVSISSAPPLHAQEHQMTDAAQVPASLVQKVRDATRKYFNVNDARKAGYGPFLGCVTGPDHGAMGIHYVNGKLFGQLEADQPQALIYEPEGNRLRLVGVEFITDAKTWLKNHNNTPPVLEGQVLQLVPAPNRFNLADFFELHVWAWRNNPNGAFVDWNNQVSCEHGG